MNETDSHTIPVVEKVLHCKQCQKPCSIVHDVEISDCCAAGTYFQEVKEQ